MQKTKTLEYYMNVTIRLAKHSGIYKAISDEYGVTGRSTESFQKAEDDLYEKLEEKKWLESFNLTYNKTYIK